MMFNIENIVLLLLAPTGVILLVFTLAFVLCWVVNQFDKDDES